VSGLPWLTLPTTGGYSSAKAVRAALSAPLSELPGARDAGAMLDGHGVGGRVLATALAALHRRPRRVA
jgi:hypothetical protein